MDKKQTRIDITETENGFQVEVTGKSLADLCSCCCVAGFAGKDISACCPPAEEKK